MVHEYGPASHRVIVSEKFTDTMEVPSAVPRAAQHPILFSRIPLDATYALCYNVVVG